MKDAIRDFFYNERCNSRFFTMKDAIRDFFTMKDAIRDFLQ